MMSREVSANTCFHPRLARLARVLTLGLGLSKTCFRGHLQGIDWLDELGPAMRCRYWWMGTSPHTVTVHWCRPTGACRVSMTLQWPCGGNFYGIKDTGWANLISCRSGINLNRRYGSGFRRPGCARCRTGIGM